MYKNNNAYILCLLAITPLIIKWMVLLIYFRNNIIVNVLAGIEDIIYFPIIISLSNLDFSPSYYQQIQSFKILTFPFVELIIHSAFYSVFGIYSFIFLEFMLRIVFALVLYNFSKKIFKNSKKSIYFCALLFFITTCLQFCKFNFEIVNIKNLSDLFNENFGTRTPRPLITGILYFFFYLKILDLKDKVNIELNFKYFLLISFLLSLFVNTFFYYFINFSILFIILFYIYSRKKFFSIIYNNKKKILIVLFSFLLFSSPFLMQLHLGEPDYSRRMGVFNIGIENKVILISYYLKNILRIEFLKILLPCVIIFTYLNIHKVKNVQIFNIFFIFIIISIFSPILFILLSPKLISIYHFLNIMFFSCIFYIYLTTFHILYELLKKLDLNILFYSKITIIFFLFIYTSLSFFNNKNFFFKEQDYLNDLEKIQNFIFDNKLKNSKYKLFTNDLYLMNMWLLNKNTELQISDGFTNAMSDTQIELNFINNIKDFNLNEEQFRKFISYGTSQVRNSFFMTLFTYKYQANSIFTYSPIDNYTDPIKTIIKNTSPFRVQYQVLPEDEKNRLISIFLTHKIDKTLLSDYVIINRTIFDKNFNIYNSDYIKILSTKYFLVYKRNIS